MNDLKTRILGLVKDELVEIEAELVHHLNPHLDLVREVAGHILFSGGKRLRPLLLVLAARMCDYRGDYDKTFSISLEYLHAATLLHDDLIDDADLRRGRPVAHSIWGNATTILVGDFLLARALTIAAGTGNIDIINNTTHPFIECDRFFLFAINIITRALIRNAKEYCLYIIEMPIKKPTTPIPLIESGFLKKI